MQLGNSTFSGSYFEKWERSANQTQFSSKSPVLQNEVVSRIKHLALVPVAAIAGSLDLIVGTLTLTASIVTLGRFSDLNAQMLKSLKKVGLVFSKTYFHLLKTVNPHAPFRDNMNDAESLSIDIILKRILNLDYEKIFAGYEKAIESQGFWNRHVVSRAYMSIMGSLVVVSAIADALLAVPLTAISFLTLGKFEKINSSAYKCLRAPIVIQGLVKVTAKIINPSSL